MAHSIKLKAGDLFPNLEATLLDGSTVTLGKQQGNATNSLRRWSASVNANQ